MGAHTALPLVRAPIPSLLALLPFFFFFFALVAVADPASESAALIKFKSSLSNTKALDTWVPGTNPCKGNQANWVGIICVADMVTGLRLENMDLSGHIDVNALASLPHLRSISVTNNRFQGPWPDFRKIGALRALFISDNQFSGKIPDDAFEGMGSLKKLFLYGNGFSGTIPTSLTRLPKLSELRASNNQFQGPIPNFPQKDLKMMDLSNNQLEGPIPPNLMKISPDSFKGNKGLCGKPIDDSGCNDPTEPPTTTVSVPTGDDPHSVTNGNNSSSPLKVILIVLACVLALSGLLAVFIIYRRSRNQTPTLGKEGSSYKSPGGVAAGAVSVGRTGSASSCSTAVSSSHGTKHTDKGVSTEMKRGNSSRKHEPVKLSFVRDDRMKFDLQDLLRASAEVLGSGNFGSSYKAVLMDGQAVVVKRFKQMNNVSREEFHEHMRRLGRLQHPNLLPLVAYYYRKEEKLLVFDFVHNGSLASHLHGNHTAERPGLNWPTRLKIVKGVAKGLSYLHNELPSLIVPHGHLKSSNVLLNKAFEPLLMDYTLVPVVNNEHAQQILVGYKSPEYAQTGRTTKKTDVWTLGILILEILTGKFPSIYLGNGVNNSTDLATWVNNVVKEETVEVFDKEMGYTMNDEDEMMKLLKIGVACCEEDVVKRLDLKEAVEKIEEVKAAAEEFVPVDV